MSRIHAAVFVLLGACTYAMPENIDPLDGTTLNVTSGDAQSALVGTTLTAPIIIQAIDLDGNPLPDLTLALDLEGGGSVPEPAIRTDSQGFATTVLTLGRAPGENRVTATVLGLDIDPAIAVATALVGPPVTLAIASGNSQQGIAGDPLAAPLVVSALDEYDNPVPGVGLELAVVEGGGSIPEASVMTGADGTASTVLTLGTAMGPNAIEARLGSLSTVTFAANGVAGPAAMITKHLGDAQNGPAGTTLPTNLTVSVEDRNGNPVEGAVVEFVALTTDGTVTPPQATTDGDGLASTSYKLGAGLGPNTIEARLTGLPIASFSASAIAGAVTQLVRVETNATSGNVASTIGPFVVEARDSGNRPVAGAIVQFRTTIGNGAAITLNVTADGDGRASSQYRLGTTAGTNRLQPTVSSGASSVSTNIDLTGNPLAAVRIAIDGVPPVRAQIEQVIALGARAVDMYGNTVTGSRTISWSAGSHQLTSTTTTANPTASNTLTITQMADVMLTANCTSNCTGITQQGTATIDVRGFRPRIDITAAAPRAPRVLIADFNADSRPDVVLAGPRSVYVAFNTTIAGTSTATLAVGSTYLTSNSDIVNAAAIGDVNGDQKSDIVLALGGTSSTVIANCIGGCIALLTNATVDNAAVPTFTITSLAETSPLNSVAIADINNDGRVDILGGGGSGAVLFGLGAGSFAAMQQLSFASSSSLDAADFNLDNRVDFVGGRYVMANATANGGMTASFTSATSLSSADVSRAVDLDGDSLRDVATCDGSRLRLYKNMSTPGAAISFTNRLEVSDGSNVLASGDLDGDSKVDLVTGYSTQVRVYRNKSTSTANALTASTVLNLSTQYAVRDIAIVDINRDGKQDIISLQSSTSNTQPSTLAVLLGE